MEEIKKVEYRYNNQIYRLNGEFFDSGNVRWMTAHLQRRYAGFAERINDENGTLIINLSHNDDGSIHYHSVVADISDELRTAINRFEKGQVD